jgi:hypothetical protein
MIKSRHSFAVPKISLYTKYKSQLWPLTARRFVETQRMSAFGGKSGHDVLLMSAFVVAFGGKAHMPFCAANVRL